MNIGGLFNPILRNLSTKYIDKRNKSNFQSLFETDQKRNVQSSELLSIIIYAQWSSLAVTYNHTLEINYRYEKKKNEDFIFLPSRRVTLNYT